MPYLDQLAAAAKRLLYGRHGEPYRIGGQTFRYLPGTRPIRLHYANSQNAVNRYDALQVLWLWAHLQEGDTAVDVGAHYGVFTILMAAKCGKRGQVVAFEPDPYAREILGKNIQLNPSLKTPRVEAIACFDRVGCAPLFCRGGNAQSSLVRTAVEFSSDHHAEVIQVPTVTLDSYLAEHSLKPRCVKMDAEGAEIAILKGATKLLASDAKIICELHPYAWPGFGNNFIELEKLVATAGRRIRYLDQQSTLSGQPQYGTVALDFCS